MRQNLLIIISIISTKYLITVEKYYVKQAIPKNGKENEKVSQKETK